MTVIIISRYIVVNVSSRPFMILHLFTTTSTTNSLFNVACSKKFVSYLSCMHNVISGL